MKKVINEVENEMCHFGFAGEAMAVTRAEKSAGAFPDPKMQANNVPQSA